MSRSMCGEALGGAVLAVVAAFPATASAAGRVAILDPSPASVELTKAATGEATGELTLHVRAERGAAGKLTLRYVAKRGPGVTPASTANGVSLTVLRRDGVTLASGQVRRVPLRLTVALPADAAVTGKLIVSIRGAQQATIDVTAAVPDARWDKAYIEPAKVTITDDSCKPQLVFGGGCGTPGRKTVEVKGLGPGKDYKEGEEVTSTGASADSGNGARAKLVATEAITDETKATELAVVVDDVSGYGTYELTLPTNRAVDKAPSLTVALKARDGLLYPAIVLALALAAQLLGLVFDDRIRPKWVLKRQVRIAYDNEYMPATDKADEENLQQPFTLGDAFDELQRKIDDADGQEQLDELVTEATGFVAVAEGWLATCETATKLHEAKEELDGEEGAASMIAACDVLLQKRPAPADRAALTAYQEQLVDQTLAAVLWKKLDDLVTDADVRYVALQGRALDAHEQRLLEEHDPTALRTGHLAGKASLEELAGVEDKIRDTITVLAALERANPAGAGAPVAVASVGDDVALSSSDEVSDLATGMRDAITPSKVLLVQIKVMDLMTFLVSVAVCLLAALAWYLANDDFGSTVDYLGVVALVTAGTLAVNWKRLPWWSSLKSTPVAKAAG